LGLNPLVDPLMAIDNVFAIIVVVEFAVVEDSTKRDNFQYMTVNKDMVAKE
jgi:hypothetical protein